MNEEQLAARRAEIPVHCAACGGAYPGTTVLHNGICDACQKLTHGPNYRLIAKLQDQERELVRLREAVLSVTPPDVKRPITGGLIGLQRCPRCGHEF